ncbi:TPA: hypothetical protein L7I91_003960 [Klebsiella aerogenes]|nr:hypothetical protein [Klebsiella aerogenes]HCB3009909.1 hypothetical protein [Klebsiella aerogenes]
MTDITRLLASLKRRSAHAKDFGDDITFVKLKDIDALVEALEREVAMREQNLAIKLHMSERIAELESRTVTVKLPKDHVDDADLFGWGVVVVPLEALKGACADAGITVEITTAGNKCEGE